MKVFYHLKEFIKENKRQYIIGIIILIFVDILQLITPKILGIITDLLETGSFSKSQISKYIGLILLVALTTAVCRFLWRIYINGTARKLEYWLRNKLFAHFEKLSLNYFNNHKTGDLMARATNDIQAIRMAFGLGIVMMTDSLFLTMATIIMLFISIDWRLTLVALCPLPIIAVLIIVFGGEVQKRFKYVQEAFSHLTDRVQETFSGIRVIKSFVQEENEMKRFSEVNEENLDMNMKLIRLFGLMFPIVMFVSSISFIIAIFYGGYMVIDDTITLGELVSFITYLLLLVWPMIAIGGVINIIQRGAASMKRINDILDAEPEIFDNENTLNIESIDGTIEFKNLSFKYPQSEICALNNINLNISEGKTIAIIGRTGSGKTTLANLILRLYNTKPGELLVGGYDINRIPLKVLRENIGYVPQDNFLFSNSIKENIAFCNPNIDMQYIQKASEVSQVKKEILEFPDKFDTKLGERGVNLSGGQKQRLCISRAIVKNPKILILDDCLSAVDTRTEENILKYLKKEMKSRTSIIISHRISTIKGADEIIVLDEGQIIERGTHDELLSMNGLYKDIYEKQQLEEKIQKEA